MSDFEKKILAQTNSDRLISGFDIQPSLEQLKKNVVVSKEKADAYDKLYAKWRLNNYFRKNPYFQEEFIKKATDLIKKETSVTLTDEDFEKYQYLAECLPKGMGPYQLWPYEIDAMRKFRDNCLSLEISPSTIKTMYVMPNWTSVLQGELDEKKLKMEAVLGMPQIIEVYNTNEGPTEPPKNTRELENIANMDIDQNEGELFEESPKTISLDIATDDDYIRLLIIAQLIANTPSPPSWLLNFGDKAFKKCVETSDRQDRQFSAKMTTDVYKTIAQNSPVKQNKVVILGVYRTDFSNTPFTYTVYTDPEALQQQYDADIGNSKISYTLLYYISNPKATDDEIFEAFPVNLVDY